MEEKRTGGGKEFIFSLLWAVIFMILGQYIIFILPSYKIIGTIITILLFCILGFFVLTRYAAIFTYSIKDDIVRVNRAIGHRNKEVEFIYGREVCYQTKTEKNSENDIQYACECIFA